MLRRPAVEDASTGISGAIATLDTNRNSTC